MAARAQENSIVSSGVGSGASATIGDMTVINLAVTLHVPNMRPIKRFSKNCSVLMYSMQKAAPVPNLPARMQKGTASSQSYALAIQRTAADSAASALEKQRPPTAPAFRTITPASRCAMHSETEETIEFVKMSPFMYLRKKFSR